MDTAPRTAPNGTMPMETASSHFPVRLSSSRNTPARKVIPPTSSADMVREMANCVCQLSITASNILIREVIPAKVTDRKKKTAKSLPMGIWLNTPGSVIKISDGPLPASIPKANTAGMMASPESRAASVSNRAVRMEAPGISTLLSRYAPYTIMPEPVIDSEKKACPMAITQVSTRSSASHFGTNRNS